MPKTIYDFLKYFTANIFPPFSLNFVDANVSTGIQLKICILFNHSEINIVEGK